MDAVAAIGLVASLAQTVFSALQTPQLKDMYSMFLCEADLDRLHDTMKQINALFLDIDAKRQGIAHTSLIWVEKLKDVVYDVDDLLDKCRTIGELRRQSKDAKLGKKVGKFFSRRNDFIVNFNVSQEIKMLRERLDAITKDHTDFSLKDVFVNKPFVREETSSVSNLQMIGREDDAKTIAGMLLSNNPHPNQTLSFVNIVGVGGLGKTALAQLVYNDDRVIKAFSERIWVCVSEVSEKFNLQQILSKILKKEAFNLEQAQGEVREHLKGKRYLLVLDDVWIESVEEWNSLKSYLVSNVSGSKVIVTTRSQKVARATGQDSALHNLKGLSEENSWCLFKLIAFGKQREDHQIDRDLLSIGKEIVKKCANVPLSIRVIASLLYDQGKDKWDSFRRINFADMSDEEYEKSIMQTLMFSYYQLRPELKSCFSFCSLFPKDHIMRKKLLINLWSAQGYLVATNNAESIEDVGEYYITILLNRCFFQDVELDEHGDVVSFKMHDLMHDLALKVAGNESLITTPNGPNDLGNKVRHLSRDRGSSILCLSNKLRTYYVRRSNEIEYFALQYYAEDSSSNEVTPIVSKCKHLRVLSLCKFGIGCSLPDKFGNLFHLRYLDLTNNRLEMLPKSITKLHNLQTLLLQECRDLKKLPDDMSKLVNLRTLDISDCEKLKELPDDIGKLVNLRTLDIHNCDDLNELPDDISKLVNLRTLDISGCEKLKELSDDIGKLVNLTLNINRCKNLNELPDDIGKLVNLRTLDISGCYFLKKLPDDIGKLVNLRTLDISRCNKLTYMPRGVEKLINLERLSDFIVGGIDVKQIEGSQLVNLQALIKNLKGYLCIKILKFSSHNMPRATNRGFILKNARLRSLTIEWGSSVDNENEFGRREVHETLLEDLCPNEHIGEIIIKGYKGTKMPSWAASLMEYSDMNGVKHVSSLSWFCCLRTLHLCDFPNVEYIMEIENDGAWESSCTLFFPVLEELELENMPKLKGWWRGLRWREMEGVAGGGCLVDDNGLEHALPLPCFPRLRDLRIDGCKSMTYFPPCPHVKQMSLFQVNDALTFCMKGSASSSSNVSTLSWCLGKLQTDNARVMNRVLLNEFAKGGGIDILLFADKQLKSMGTLREGFERVGCTLVKLAIRFCPELDIEEEEEEGMPWKYLQSLSSLELWGLPKMVKLPKGLRHLTSLQSLQVKYCLNMEEFGECISSLTSLQSLELDGCNKLKGLPEIIGVLTSLQSLKIDVCPELESLLESMPHLTSLSSLSIYNASDEFRKKCREPDGEYWPRISHITKLVIR